MTIDGSDGKKKKKCLQYKRPEFNTGDTGSGRSLEKGMAPQ